MDRLINISGKETPVKDYLVLALPKDLNDRAKDIIASPKHEKVTPTRLLSLIADFEKRLMVKIKGLVVPEVLRGFVPECRLEKVVYVKEEEKPVEPVNDAITEPEPIATDNSATVATDEPVIDDTDMEPVEPDTADVDSVNSELPPKPDN